MKAIAAMSNNRVIGNDGRLPWKCKEDLAFFKKMTMGGTLIMGHTTFKNVGLLTDRYIYVLTRNQAIPKYIIDHDLEETRVEYGPESNLPLHSKNLWLCGGASVYELLLPQCSDLYLTIILDDYEGDTYMPDFDHLFVQQRTIVETKSYWIVHYWNITGNPHEESYREGFDALWMGKTRRDNPWITPRNVGFAYEQQQAWIEGWTDAANKKFEISVERVISEIRI